MVYEKPVKVGDVVSVEVINLGERGDGIAKIDDFVIFVAGGQIDVRYDVKIKKVFDSFAVSEIVKGGK